MLPLWVVSCSDDEDILPEQQKKIESFMRNTLRLVDEEELDEGSRLPFYRRMAGRSVYRYINEEDYYNPERENFPEVTSSSKVTLTFRNYVFEGKKISGIPDGGITEDNIQSVTPPFYTNDPAFEEYMYMVGLTPGVWKFEPLVIDMRRPHILKGVAVALKGCRQGDAVQVYMTYDMAYGDDENIYMVPKESPVAVFLEVMKVE